MLKRKGENHEQANFGNTNLSGDSVKFGGAARRRASPGPELGYAGQLIIIKRLGYKLDNSVREAYLSRETGV
jgi:hypothetical protein